MSIDNSHSEEMSDKCMNNNRFYRSNGDNNYWTTFYVEIEDSWRAYHVHDEEVEECMSISNELDWERFDIKPVAVSDLPNDVLRRIEKHVEIDN